VQTITLGSPLEEILYPVLIDAVSKQQGFQGTPVVEVKNGAAGAIPVGLQIEAAGTTVRGLMLDGFDTDGILLEVGADNCVVQKCALVSNGEDGIVVGSSSNTVGGASSVQGNLISGNPGAGVHVLSPDTPTTQFNVVQGNLIGTDSSGSAAQANGVGVLLEGNSTSNTIGGVNPSLSNVISGNKSDGVRLTGTGVTNNLITGNLIGVQQSGVAALGNGGSGVDVTAGASNNTVGGTQTAGQNVLSGNSADGVRADRVGRDHGRPR
jgi:hypothetical protein